MSKPNLFVRVLLRVIRMRVLLRLAVRLIRMFGGRDWLDRLTRDWLERHRAQLTTHLPDCINNTPTTIPTMYMAQAERLRWVLVELNMKYSPRSAIPKLLAVTSFAT
jgi:hypothetical protein